MVVVVVCPPYLDISCGCGDVGGPPLGIPGRRWLWWLFGGSIGGGKWLLLSVVGECGDIA